MLSDTTHNFKLYIDNVLQGTYESGTDIKLDWQTLNLSTGGETTFPTSLKTHIIRITPENGADTLQSFTSIRGASSGAEPQGILWIHCAFSYPIARIKLSNYNAQVRQAILVAITAIGDNLHFSGDNLTGFISNVQDRYTQRSSYLAKLPTIEVDTLNGLAGMFNHAGPLKKVKLVVNNSITAGGADNTINSTSFISGNTEEIEINKPIIISDVTARDLSLFRASSLKSLPALDFSAVKRLVNFLTANTHLQDTVLDVSPAVSLQVIQVQGTASIRMDGLKGLIVSNAAPFDYATAPQINVSYTGLDRVALINLFNSLPTVTDSQVCDITGCTGASDLTAEDLAIATAKGWTVTR